MDVCGGPVNRSGIVEKPTKFGINGPRPQEYCPSPGVLLIKSLIICQNGIAPII